MSRQTRRTLLFLLLAVPLLQSALACSARSRRPAEQQPSTHVSVVNSNFLDMTIYVVRGGQRIRLGIAASNSTTLLEIPSHLIFGPTALSFLADPIGGNRRPFTQEITVSPGDEVSLMIR